jgi:hypothetical protein
VGWARSQSLAKAAAVVAGERNIGQAGAPSAHIVGKHTIGLACLCQYFTAFKDDMVLEGKKPDAAGSQYICNPCVSGYGLGFVVAARKHRLHL